MVKHCVGLTASSPLAPSPLSSSVVPPFPPFHPLKLPTPPAPPPLPPPLPPLSDHEADILAMVKHYVGLTAVKAKMLDLDRLGFNLQVVQEEGGPSFKVRLPFVR